MAQTTAWEKVLSLISRTLIVSGVLLILFACVLFVERYNPYRLSFKTSIESPKSVDSKLSKPTRIAISGSPINLPIVESTIHGQEWETTSKGVSYLTLSPKPGEVGNSILYGHNWTNLLGPLVRVKPGQTITISYADGTRAHFMVQATAVVSPKDTSILLPSKDSMLTIYTCSGFMDSKRFVVTAKKV